jgi:hypothetical protein
VIHHPEGRKLLGKEQVPKEIAEAYLPHALMMNVRLYYNMPLKMAIEVAQLVLSEEAPYDHIEELNDCFQRDKMAEYLELEPGMYSQMSWDKLHQKYLDECKKDRVEPKEYKKFPPPAPGGSKNTRAHYNMESEELKQKERNFMA